MNLHRNVFQRIKDRLWGYDFFVSYHWGSGGRYAVNLAQRLRDLHYDVFLDRADYASGDDWKILGEIALRNTQRLVLIATRDAVTKSKPVEREVTLFSDRGRHLISIVFGDRFTELNRADYPTLQQIAESQLFIDDEPANAQSGPSDAVIAELTRTHRVLRRRNLRAILTLVPAVAVVLFAISAGVSAWLARLSAREALASEAAALDSAKAEKLAKDDAIEQKHVAETRLLESRRVLTRLYTERAYADFDGDDNAAGLLWLTRSLETIHAAGDPETTARFRLAAHSAGLLPLCGVYSHRHPIYSIAVSQDGRIMIAGCSDMEAILRGQGERGAAYAQVWNLETGSPIGSELAHPDGVRKVALSRDGATAVTTNGESQLRIWNLSQLLSSPEGAVDASGTAPATSWDEPLVIEYASQVYPDSDPTSAPFPSALAISNDNQVLAVGDSRGRVSLWDLARGQFRIVLGDHKQTVEVLKFSPSGETLLVAGGARGAPPGFVQEDTGGYIRLWNWETRSAIGEIMREESPVQAAAFSSDGKIILSGCKGGLSRVWQTAETSPSGAARQFESAVTDIEFSADGTSFLVASGGVQLYDAGTFESRGDPISGASEAAFGADGRSIVTMNGDAVRCWKVPSSFPLRQTFQQKAAVNVLALCGDGQTVAAGCADGTAHLWDTATGKEAAEVRHPEETEAESMVHALAFSSDRLHFFTGGVVGLPGPMPNPALRVPFGPVPSLPLDVRRWDAKTGLSRGAPLPHPASVNAVAASPDGATLLTGCHDGRARLWDLATDQLIREFAGHERSVTAVAYSRDGQRVLTGSEDGTARLWDAATGQPHGAPIHHGSRVSFIGFTPRGELLTAGGDLVRVWDETTRAPRGNPLRPSGTVKGLACHGIHGSLVLAGCSDGTVCFFDLDDALPAGPPWSHQDAVNSVAFAAESQTALTACDDGAVRVWNVPEPLAGDVQFVRLWIEVITGVEMNEVGETRLLDSRSWSGKQNEVRALESARGGP